MPMTILVTPSKYIFVLFSKRRISLVSQFAVSRSNYESSSRDDVSESDYNFFQKEPVTAVCHTSFFFMFLNVGSFCDFFMFYVFIVCLYSEGRVFFCFCMFLCLLFFVFLTVGWAAPHTGGI